jgi:hypothetical protein
MKNQEIGTIPGTIILIIIAVTVCMFVWVYERGQEAIEQSQQMNNSRRPAVTKTSQNNQSDKLATTDSAKTSTYTNNTYRFEFEYPQGLVIAQDSTDSVFGLANKPDEPWAINISVSINTDNLSLDQVFNKELARYKKPGRNILISDVTVGGKPAKRFSVQSYGDGGNAVTALINGENIITIYGTDSVTSSKTILETVLKSFRFKKSEGSAGNSVKALSQPAMPTVRSEAEKSPEELVKDFYNWYIGNTDYNYYLARTSKGNDHVDIKELVKKSPFISSTYEQNMNKTSGGDPILCSQDTDQNVFKETQDLVISGNRAQVYAIVELSSSPEMDVKIQVMIKKEADQWKIDEINCSQFRL